MALLAEHLCPMRNWIKPGVSFWFTDYFLEGQLRIELNGGQLIELPIRVCPYCEMSFHYEEPDIRIANDDEEEFVDEIAKWEDEGGIEETNGS